MASSRWILSFIVANRVFTFLYWLRYRQFLGEMLNELERHRDDQARRVIWLQEVTPLMEAMGLVLVAHFSRLLPLLYYWLHAPDDLTCLLVCSSGRAREIHLLTCMKKSDLLLLLV